MYLIGHKGVMIAVNREISMSTALSQIKPLGGWEPAATTNDARGTKTPEYT